jgi:hypothetical protein
MLLRFEKPKTCGLDDAGGVIVDPVYYPTLRIIIINKEKFYDPIL